MDKPFRDRAGDELSIGDWVKFHWYLEDADFVGRVVAFNNNNRTLTVVSHGDLRWLYSSEVQKASNSEVAWWLITT